MSKAFNDVVVLVRNGVKLNALVAQSTQQADGEHLTVVYLDPSKASALMGGSAVDAAIQKAFVKPRGDGQINGWEEVPVPDSSAGTVPKEAHQLVCAKLGSAIDELGELRVKFDAATEMVEKYQAKLAQIEAEAAQSQVNPAKGALDPTSVGSGMQEADASSTQVRPTDGQSTSESTGEPSPPKGNNPDPSAIDLDTVAAEKIAAEETK